MSTKTWNGVLLVLNLLLALAVFDLHRWERRIAEARFTPPSLPRLSSRNPSNPTNEPSQAETKGTPPNPFHWSQLESGDYRQYVANLQAIGCPQETVEDILRADVSALSTRQRAKDLEGINQRLWEMIAAPHREGTDKIDDQLSAPRRERDRVLAQLLGPNKDEMVRLDECELRYEVQEYTFLPEAKRAHLKKLETDRMQSIRTVGEKIKDPLERRNAVQRLQDEEKLAIAQTLDSREMRLFELYTSGVAQELWNRLGTFEPAEEEFLNLFAVQRALEAEKQGVNVSKEVRERMNQRMEERYRTTLGETRYQELLMNRNQHYQQALKVTERLGIPPQRATEVMGVAEAAQGQAKDVLADEGLPADQRQAALGSLQEAAQNAVRELIGDRGFQVYTNHAGQWIRDLGPE